MRPLLIAFPVMEKIGLPVRSIKEALKVDNPGAENSSCNAATARLTAYRISGLGCGAKI